MPKKFTSGRFDKVIRLKFDAPILAMVQRGCEAMDIEAATFLRNLIRHQQGTMDWVRSQSVKPARAINGKTHPTKPFNLYMSMEMFDFLQALANKHGCSKKGILSILACEYFGVLQLRLTQPPPN